MSTITKDTTPPISAEIASLATDPNIFAGYILENPDTTIIHEGGGKGIALYDEVDRDPHAGSVLQTRRLAVSGEKWDITPGEDSQRGKEIAEFVAEVLRNTNFRQACAEMLQAILYGYSPAEIIWKQRPDGRIGIDKIRRKHPRRFAFNLDRELKLLTRAAPMAGEAVPERKFLVLTMGDSDNPYGKGLGQSLWWSVWFKKHGIKFWMIFLDKFSMPTPIGKHPDNAEEPEKKTLMEAIKAVRTETGVTIPESMAIDLLEASRGGDASYEKVCDFFDRQTSKRVLGQTLTTEVSGGSYAASQTHNEVRQDIKDADAGQLAEYLNETLIPWLVDYNYAGVTQYPAIAWRTEQEETLKELAERDVLLVKEVGVVVDPNYWYDTYRLPRPPGGAKVIPPQQSAVPGPAFAEALPAPAEFTPGQQAMEDLADRSLSRDPLAKNEAQIAGIVQGAADYEEAMERLLAFYADMDVALLQAGLENALINAELLGRKEVQDGDR